MFRKQKSSKSEIPKGYNSPIKGKGVQTMNSEKGFVGYECTDVAVKREQQELCADGYPNFGYELGGTQAGSDK
jgi:hypothetical protein